MNEYRYKQYTCCFTGHRPEKINISEERVKVFLSREIKKAVEDGFRIFITGMSRGVDLWAGEIVLNLKNKISEIKLICAIPYNGFERKWCAGDRELYYSIMDRADKIYFICSNFSYSCFQVRNIWMVDHSDRVIAFYRGIKGGTQNTIDYAKRNKIQIIYI